MTVFWRKRVLEHLAEVGGVDLRKISEPMRQRLIDLAMEEPPLVDVDADRVFLTQAGHLAASGH
jgi:hypothetical protein